MATDPTETAGSPGQDRVTDSAAGLPNRYVVEFGGDDGPWTLDVRAEVDEEGTSHVHIIVEERRNDRKRAKTITVDLAPCNARGIGEALVLAADWCLGQGGTDL